MKPTLQDAVNFDAKNDVQVLNRAFNAHKTDDTLVLKILGRRSNKQRILIAEQYEEMYGKTLVETLESKLKAGVLQTVCASALTPHYEYLASELHGALKGIGTNEETLSEVLGTANNETIRNVHVAYKKLYETALEKDLKKGENGSFERLLVMLCRAKRDENENVDVSAAKNDAKSLYNADEAHMNADEKTLNTVLALRSFAQLRQVFEEYKAMSGHEFAKDIEKEFAKGADAGMINIVRQAENPAKFFAMRLHDTREGTMDNHVTRVVLSRSELDLGDIKDEFKKLYKDDLKEHIEEETSRDVKKLLLVILG